MPRILPDADVRDLVDRYLAGATGYELAERFGVSKSTVYRVLDKSGVDLRRLPMHKARADSTASFGELCQRAATREANGTQSSPLEARFADLLTERGVPKPVPQKAIGPYNVDLAIGPVAVEIWGGGWHGSGAHLERFEERTSYVLDAGWWQICVWSPNTMPSVPAAADQVVAFYEFARTHPAADRKHWVIWGTGQPVGGRRFNLGERTFVPAD